MIIYAADDEILSLNLLEDAITEALPGAETVCFQSSKMLLEAVLQRIPDIVFLDINMPEYDGIEIAGMLNQISNAIKIVFVTGYSEFAKQAFDVYAFGYIMKPCRAERIRGIIEKMGVSLNNTVDIVIKTFGNFDVFINGKPVTFRSAKGKELLAYLVDREGEKVSRQKAAEILYGEEYSHTVQVGLSKIVSKLTEDLDSAGAEGLFVNDNGYSVDFTHCICDMIEFIKENMQYSYNGEYMEQYSWGECRKSFFEKVR